METIGQIAHTVETTALAAYLTEAGPTARPMTSGRYGLLFWFGAFGAGIIAPLALNLRRRARPRKILSSLLSLAGGLALKWVLVHGGRESSMDPDANRYASRPGSRAPGWGGHGL